MDDEAALVLRAVKVNGRTALFSAFADRLVVVDREGTRTIPMTDVARITHKAGMRSGRLGIMTVEAEELVIRGLRARDTPTAYQLLVRLAQDAN